jgi:hypothetical protein
MSEERTEPTGTDDDGGIESVTGKPSKAEAIRTVAIMAAILATRVEFEGGDHSQIRDPIAERPDRVAGLAIVLYEASVDVVAENEHLWREPDSHGKLRKSGDVFTLGGGGEL